ncbi:MAG: hypothetical protein JNM17_03710 [Archangium sp.]|nr:hypothetical protein [Archangium sp.]
MRALLVFAVLSQSAFAQDPPSPLVLRQRLAKILKLSLNDSVPATRPVITTPIAPLACQVFGTLQSRVVEYSLASVQCGKRFRSVRVGDELEDGVVEEIGFGTITVRRGDRLELIGRGAIRSADQSAGAIASAQPIVPVEAPPPVRAALEQGRVPRAMVKDALENPGPLLGQVQRLPAFAAGKWVGLRASFVKEGSVVSALGLQKNDVIRTVNGKPLDSIPSALAVLQTLSSASDLDVELDRGGQTITRRVRIE